MQSKFYIFPVEQISDWQNCAAQSSGIKAISFENTLTENLRLKNAGVLWSDFFSRPGVR